MKTIPAILLSLILTAPAIARQTVEDQIPDYKSLPDSTADLQAQIDKSGSLLLLPKDENTRAIFRITQPLVFDLAKLGAVSVKAAAGVTLIMDGPGPALRFHGSHDGSASPKSFQPATWNERMPIVSSIEILGAHPEADGIELDGCVEPIINRTAVRWCRHGIHLVRLNRNVTISDCHLYENDGIGLYFDDVNLHQTNVSNCHISYNRGGGIVVRDGAVRNLQVTGCDIEANMPGDETSTETANVLLDVSGSPEDKSKSIAEVAITGCTIQHSANYGKEEGKTVAPGGANIRLRGKEIWPIDSVAITGNVISDTTVSVDIDMAMDVTLTGNTFFAPKPDNLRVTNSQRVIVDGNTFNPRQFIRPGTIRFTNCEDCILSDCTFRDFSTAEGALILDNCGGMLLSGLNFIRCGSGIVLKMTTETTIAHCRISGTTEGGKDFDADELTRKDLILTGNRFTGLKGTP